MKRLVFFCMLLSLVFTSAFAQFASSTVPPASALNQYVKKAVVDASIRWEDGTGYATVTLPFSLTNTVPTILTISIVYSYEIKDNTIEFTFNSPTPEMTKVNLQFEDKEFSFGYMDTPTGHAYFAYKWKYIVDINFTN